jgi:hypothetical protein
MRAAVVGGTAYYAGKKVSEGRQAEADQNAQIADLQAQQDQQAYQQPPAPAPAGGAEGIADQIERLKGLLDSGALTPEEYAAAKQQVLQGG